MDEKERRRVAQRCMWAIGTYDGHMDFLGNVYDEMLNWGLEGDHESLNGCYQLVPNLEEMIITYCFAYERTEERIKLVLHPLRSRLPLLHEITERFDPTGGHAYQRFLMVLKGHAALRAMEEWDTASFTGGMGMDLWRRFARAALSLESVAEVPNELSPEDKEEELDGTSDHAA